MSIKPIIIALFLAVLVPVGGAAAQGTVRSGTARYDLTYDTERRSHLAGGMKADGVRHARDAWWFTRFGSATREYPLPAPDAQNYAGNRAQLVWYDLRGRGIEATLTIEVFPSESGAVAVTQQLAFRNTSSSAVTVKVFAHADYDVAGSTPPENTNDRGYLSRENVIRIQSGSTTARFRGRNARAWQVWEWESYNHDLLNSSATTLRNRGLPFGPGDFTGAFQWNTTIAPGESRSFILDMSAGRGLAGADLCGNGVIDAGETCDDGFVDGCGTCNATCTSAGLLPICGERFICPETLDCDDGIVEEDPPAGDIPPAAEADAGTPADDPDPIYAEDDAGMPVAPPEDAYGSDGGVMDPPAYDDEAVDDGYRDSYRRTTGCSATGGGTGHTPIWLSLLLAMWWARRRQS